MNRPPDLDKEDRYERERIRYQWMLDSIQKFRVFFAGLIFAMLSFSIQFSIPATSTIIKYIQISAWVLLLITGILALKDAGGFKILDTENSFSGLGKKSKFTMWFLFVSSLLLLMAARACSI